MTHDTTRTLTDFARRTVLAAVAAVLALGSLGVSPDRAEAAYPSFTFSGSGYGHGIGLSQYGAKGWAEHGKTGQWIAQYYYPGSITKKVAVDHELKVNIDKGKSSSNGGFVRASWVIRPGYTSSTLDVYVAGAFKHTLTEAGGPYTFTASGNQVVIKNGAGSVLGTYAEAKVVPRNAPSGSPQLTQVVSASGPFGHTYVRYRQNLIFTASGGLTKCVNEIWMQEYLMGVVPRESPSSWHLEALKAQAIVARSYAWPSRNGELYCTTWSQVYNGHSRGDRGAPTMHEATTSNKAVTDTSQQFVTYNDQIITTYFSSSSGGHSASIEDVWLGTGEPSSSYPYRAGVPDPYCASPYDPWPDPLKIDGMALASKLAAKTSDEPAGTGTSVYVRSLELDRAFPSGFVRRITVNWSNGAVSRDISGDAVRNALGLRSTKFYVNGAYVRVAYGDRYDTSAKISASTFTTGPVPAAVIVNGADAKFADALTASALAGVVGGPVLMVRGDGVPSSVSAELARLKSLGCTKVYIVGGEASVAKGVQTTLAKSFTVERLAGNARYGTDRYGTAATVAMKMKALDPTVGANVLVASGEKWPDAAIAAGIAAGTRRPVVLTRASALPNGSKAVLGDLGAKTTVVFGGKVSITDAALKPILAVTKETAPAKRFGLTGSRYDVAVEASKWAVASLGYRLTTVYIASGETFPDSVTGGVVSGRDKRPLLLTNSKTATAATAKYLSESRNSITGVKVFGGVNSVTDSTASTLASYTY